MVILGRDVKTGQSVSLDSRARGQGVYVIGTTGTGKSTLLQNIAYQDINDPNKPGVCVLDPHGDFVDNLLARIPEHRVNDVVLFEPASGDQFERPLGLNIFQCDRSDPKQTRRVASTVVDTLRKLFFYSWGPRMEDLLRHSVLTLLEHDDTTFLELLLILASQEHRTRFTRDLKDPVLRHFWQEQFANYDKRQRVEVVGSSLNKIGRFLVDPLIRDIVSQRYSAFNLRSIMDEGKILLVNLSKGELGEDNSALLGAVLVNLVLIAALQRRDIPPEHRRPFHLIVDEYQSFATESFPTLQSEARKYGITVLVAHQYRDQLDDLNKGSTLNVANFAVMRVSGRDSYVLADQFDNKPPPGEIKKEPVYRPIMDDENGRTLYSQSRSTSGAGTLYQDIKEKPRPFSDVSAERANDLSGLPNYELLCRLVQGRDLKEYRVRTDPPLGQPNPRVAAYIRQRSLMLGMNRKAVEEDIQDRIGGDIDFSVIGDLEPYDDDQY